MLDYFFYIGRCLPSPGTRDPGTPPAPSSCWGRSKVTYGLALSLWFYFLTLISSNLISFRSLLTLLQWRSSSLRNYFKKQMIHQGSSFFIFFTRFFTWISGNEITTKYVTVDLSTSSRPWRYRQISGLELTKAILFVGNRSSHGIYRVVWTPYLCDFIFYLKLRPPLLSAPAPC